MPTRLRQKTRRFKRTSLSSIALAIELFNRPHEVCRSEATLILLNHAVEMLLKGAIWQARGRIAEEPEAGPTYTFLKCLSIARSDLTVLTEDESRNLSAINALRDCAVHNVLSISEQTLYLMIQSGVTLYSALLVRCFQQPLAEHLPARVLPISSTPPKDIALYAHDEVAVIKDLLKPGRRTTADAEARLLPLLLLNESYSGELETPIQVNATQGLKRIREGATWEQVLPGVAALRLDSSGEGPSVSIRLVRGAADITARILGPDEPDPSDGSLKIREIDWFDRYSLGTRDLYKKLGISQDALLGLVRHFRLQDNAEYFGQKTIGKQTLKRYSPKALELLRAQMKVVDVEEIRRTYGPSAGSQRRVAAAPGRKV